MQTIKSKITSVSSPEILKNSVFQSTGLFYKLYNNPELLEDKMFKQEMLSKFDLIDVYMFECIVNDIKCKLKQRETFIKKSLAEIKQIEDILAHENKKIITKKKRYKLINKLARLKRRINKNCCFGGKSLLEKITKHAQLSKNSHDKLSDKEVLENKRLYEKELKEFRTKRSLGVYLIGACNKQCNRKINFDLPNKTIIFKLNRDNHIEIKFSERREKELFKLQELINHSLIPVTVRINNENICFSYDEAILNGFNFDKNEFNRTIKKHKISTTEGRKEVSKDFFRQQEQRKLVGKIGTRFGAVDINPYEIGIVKYIKGGSLYPDIAKINRQKLTYLVGENIQFQNFVSLYKHVTCAGLRYRNREIISRVDTNLKSYKSKVKVLCL